MVPNGPDMGKNGPHMGPNGPDMGPNGPFMGPKGLEKDEKPYTDFFFLSTFLNMNGIEMQHDRPDMVLNRP